MPANPLLDLNRRLVIAHRGNRIRAPENTMGALRQAVELGADALEFDVRLSRDGVPVIMHDSRVDRTTDGIGDVATMTLAELRALDAAARSPYRVKRVPVPTLEEVLDAFRDVPVVIEVKEMAAAESTADMVRRFAIQDHVLIGSPRTEVMQWFYGSGISSCASMRDATRMIPIGLFRMRTTRPPYQVLSITRSFRGFPIPVLPMARAARAIGIPTHVWTVNEPDVARRLWDGGVSGIVTDDPAAMIKARGS